MEGKYEKYFDIIFYIVSLIMVFHFAVKADGWPATICLWLFILCDMMHAQKTRNLLSSLCGYISSGIILSTGIQYTKRLIFRDIFCLDE